MSWFRRGADFVSAFAAASTATSMGYSTAVESTSLIVVGIGNPAFCSGNQNQDLELPANSRFLGSARNDNFFLSQLMCCCEVTDVNLSSRPERSEVEGPAFS
jgi:hypothetical protein